MKKTFVFLLFLTQSCYAGDAIPDYMKIHEPFGAATCSSANTQHEMDACGRKSLAMATKKMEQILAKLKKNHKANEPKLFVFLEKDQASWETYKTTGCEFETYYSRNGSGYESILNVCLETKVNERISYLQWMLDHP